MIVVKNLSKEFGTHFSLENINLTITSGEKISIFGPNGAGKTSFLRILSCLVKPTKGSFTILGYAPTERVQILKRIGFAAQSGHLYEPLTVYQNLEFYGKMYDLDQDRLTERVGELLKQFDLTEKTHHKVSTLSKGMKQRLIICKALIHNPEILLLDEPYSGLDIKSIEKLDSYLHSFTEKTILTATHDFDTGVKRGQRVIIFNYGSIVFDDQWTEDSKSFKEFYKRMVAV